MIALFYLSSAVAIIATLAVITRRNAVHALLYLIVSLLAVAVIFFIVGAPFVAALEVIVYAGAILVLFLFAVMILGAAPPAAAPGRARRSVRSWAGPAGLSFILLVELIVVLISGEGHEIPPGAVPPRAVGLSMFSTYLLGVELAGAVLLAALVGAYHVGRRSRSRGASAAEGVSR